jgi:2-octaprenyl-6-methoxyphenol hydroxylase
MVKPQTKTQNASAAFDVAIVGAGAVGLAMALACEKNGLSTTLIAPDTAAPASRSVALFVKAVTFLQTINAWEALEPYAYPLKKLRIIDDTPSLFRPPAVTFDAQEIGLSALGYSFELPVLLATLRQKLQNTTISHFNDIMEDIEVSPSEAKLTLHSGQKLTAKLVIAADGRNSPVRKAAGINVKTWHYPQVALTVRVHHTRDQECISTEMHTRTGPFTWVPLNPHEAGIVWLTTPEHGQELMTMTDTEFAKQLYGASHGLLGDIKCEGARHLMNMEGLSAKTLTAPRIALIGEAAHAFPPIGAQGLNMGLADASALHEALDQALKNGEGQNCDEGSALILAAYTRVRQSDMRMRTAMVDGLNRALLSSLMPVDFMRGAGLLALGQISPLRKMIMKAGLR